MVAGRAKDESALERELIVLVRKTWEQPARLSPSDLEPLREIAGDDALDYALVIGTFHFINRIADLLDVSLEAMPKPLRRFEFLRRMNVSIAGRLLAKMDMRNRSYPFTFNENLETLSALLEAHGSPYDHGLESLKARPKLLEVTQQLLEEKTLRCSLDQDVLIKINQAVETVLPATIDQARGFQQAPQDAIERLAFVGTRFAYRTTKAMIDMLHQQGYDDLGILDLAIAVADANMWTRIYRLFGLNANLLYEVKT